MPIHFNGYYSVTIEYKSGIRHYHPAVLIQPLDGGWVLTPKGSDKSFTIKAHAWKNFEYKPCPSEETNTLPIENPNDKEIKQQN